MKILILTIDQELAMLRQRVLQDAGHEVIMFTTEKAAVEAAENGTVFDVALLCHRMPTATARKIIRILRDSKREAKVIYIGHIYGEWPEVEADRYVVGADGPDALLRVISETTAAAGS